MGLINDDKIPAAIDDRIDSLLVIFLYSLIRPSGMFLDWLDGIHRRNDLIILTIDIVCIRQAPDRVVI